MKKNMHPSIAIVVVGYNREKSLMRLLNSLSNSYYDDNKVDLIISLDKSDIQDQLVNSVEEFTWSVGNKTIRAFQERQGLRKHILQCGELTQDYDAVVVLEDDLEVSPYYYQYVQQAVNFYRDEENIAGISLYKHEFHPGVLKPFEPVHNGYDAYFMQFAQSWGQCWTKNMWSEFYTWYLENEDIDFTTNTSIPNYIRRWNKHSWLKYYMLYIVEKNKYFIYPRISLSTNHSDVGEHNVELNNNYQVSMLQGSMNFRFPSYTNAIKYDVYFERTGIENELFPSLKGDKMLDLYGGKDDWTNVDFIISTAELPYKIIEEIQLKYRPIEINCLAPIAGKGIYIYDAHIEGKLPKKSETLLTRYFVRGMHWKGLLGLGWNGFTKAISLRWRRKNE